MLTTDYVPGAPCWIDLGSPDVAAAAAFYGRVLGWEHVSLGPDAGGYGLFQAAGQTVAAIGPLSEGASSAWTVYFATPDPDDAARAVTSAGGAVRVEPFDIGPGGRIAQCTDPGGAEFALGTINGLDAVSTPGALTWLELHTPDGASSFYGTVFGWESVPIPGAGEFFRPAGTGAGRLFGAVVADESAYWLPYFEVVDPDAAVAGVDTVVVPPTDLEGVGRFAVLTDPFGARFAVLRSDLP